MRCMNFKALQFLELHGMTRGSLAIQGAYKDRDMYIYVPLTASEPFLTRFPVSHTK